MGRYPCGATCSYLAQSADGERDAEKTRALAIGLRPREKSMYALALGRSSGFRFILPSPLPAPVGQWLFVGRPRSQRRDRAGFTPASLSWPDWATQSERALPSFPRGRKLQGDSFFEIPEVAFDPCRQCCSVSMRASLG